MIDHQQEAFKIAKEEWLQSLNKLPEDMKSLVGREVFAIKIETPHAMGRCKTLNQKLVFEHEGEVVIEYVGGLPSESFKKALQLYVDSAASSIGMALATIRLRQARSLIAARTAAYHEYKGSAFNHARSRRKNRK